jgi:hypothetical protein
MFLLSQSARGCLHRISGLSNGGSSVCSRDTEHRILMFSSWEDQEIRHARKDDMQEIGRQCQKRGVVALLSMSVFPAS